MLHPSRPSGVVSYYIPLWNPAGTIAIGYLPRPFCAGMRYCTYIWFTTICAGSAPGRAVAKDVVMDCPLTKKLPASAKDKGPVFPRVFPTLEPDMHPAKPDRIKIDPARTALLRKVGTRELSDIGMALSTE